MLPLTENTELKREGFTRTEMLHREPKVKAILHNFYHSALNKNDEWVRRLKEEERKIEARYEEDARFMGHHLRHHQPGPDPELSAHVPKHRSASKLTSWLREELKEHKEMVKEKRKKELKNEMREDKESFMKEFNKDHPSPEFNMFQQAIRRILKVPADGYKVTMTNVYMRDTQQADDETFAKAHQDIIKGYDQTPGVKNYTFWVPMVNNNSFPMALYAAPDRTDGMTPIGPPDENGRPTALPDVILKHIKNTKCYCAENLKKAQGEFGYLEALCWNSTAVHHSIILKNQMEFPRGAFSFKCKVQTIKQWENDPGRAQAVRDAARAAAEAAAKARLRLSNLMTGMGRKTHWNIYFRLKYPHGHNIRAKLDNIESLKNYLKKRLMKEKQLKLSK